MLKPKEIKQIMAALGMRRPTELAIRCGVTDDTVRKWLSGHNSPSGAAMILLYQLKAEADAVVARRPRRELVEA